MRGDGGVYRPKDRSSWYCYAPAKPKRAIRGPFKTETEARKEWKALRKEIAGGTYRGPEAERITVGEILKTYLVNLALTQKDKSPSHQANVKALREELGNFKAAELTVDVVNRTRARWLARGLKEATTDRYLETLRAAYRLAQKQERITRRPMFDLIKANNTRTGFADEETFWKVHAELPELEAEAALFAYRSSWRREEVEALTWEQVDLKTRVARLWDSKSGETRELPLEGELWSVIQRRQAARTFLATTGPALSAHVFHYGGTPLSAYDWRKQWYSACVKACAGHFIEVGEGKKKRKRYVGLLFHDLRRSAIKNMVDAGIPQVTIMAISGHKSDSVFRRYAIRTTKETRQALRATLVHLHGESGSATEQLRSE